MCHFKKVLPSALPYLDQASFSALENTTIVIKYGGNAMIDSHLKSLFAHDIALLKRQKIRPVIVHGGGPQINYWLKKIGIKDHFFQGFRVTDSATMEIVEMVLAGQVNKEIASLITHYEARAIGITGKDAGMILASKQQALDENGSEFDLGFVGHIQHVDASIINTLLDMDIIPVIAPIGMDAQGQTYNINADVAAAKISETLKADKLLLLTNTSGILDDQSNLIPEISPSKAKELIRLGTISSGMIPKINSALESIKNGVTEVCIMDGRLEHAVLQHLLGRNKLGTNISI